jgi:hypothetical protein
MIYAKRVYFSDGVVWVFEGYNDDTGRWIQIRMSNLFGVNFSDAIGTHSVLQYARANEGNRVRLGSGAHSKIERVTDGQTAPVDSGYAPYAYDGGRSYDVAPTSSRECVRDSMALLVSPSELVHIQQPCPDLLLTALPSFYRNSKHITLLQPSQWGILHDPRNFRDAINDLCTHSAPTDSFILQVHKQQAATTLHCVAVSNKQINDPSTQFGWLPLSISSFAKLDIDRMRGGFKVVCSTGQSGVPYG